jgi:hypothetical protein
VLYDFMGLLPLAAYFSRIRASFVGIRTVSGLSSDFKLLKHGRRTCGLLIEVCLPVLVYLNLQNQRGRGFCTANILHVSDMYDVSIGAAIVTMLLR